ncbi:MAG: thiamine diphosphokinase [Bacteroidetes bacterium]|nr:thiamine diphosphokinase [Bacteroidota bacterium]
MQCSMAILEKLYHQSKTVIVLDGAIERVLKTDIRIDVLLGDFDRIKPSHKKFQISPEVEIVKTPDQNKTDLQKAIEFLISLNFEKVDIIWATGFRTDHTFNNIITLGKYFKKINCTMYDDYSSIFAIPKTFEKMYKKGDIISLFPLGKVSGITTSGLLYNMKNENLQLPVRTGSSNEVSENGIIKISYKTGILILMECKD